FASRTAKKLPNALEIDCASSSMLGSPPSRRDTLPQLEHPSRFVSRDEHDDAAVENESQSGAAAAEPGVGRRLQRNQNERTDQRPVEPSGPAQRGNNHNLYRDENSESALRIDEPRLDRVKRAGDRGEHSAEHE